MIDIRQAVEYANYLKSLGWVVKRIGGVNYFIKKIPLIGSILKIQRPERIRYKDIKILSKKYRVFQIIIEPKNKYQVSGIKYHGFKLSKSPYLPTKTLQIDLTESQKVIFSHFKKDAKSALRITNNLELITNNLRDLENFRKAWKKAVGWKRYIPPANQLIALKKSFYNNSLFICDHDKTAGAIFLIADKTGYYWQAFTSRAGRASMAQYKIVWQGILLAKKQSCRVFDFEGIFDSRFPNKSWLGFTHFKKSFGGYEVSYPGCYTKLCLKNLLGTKNY